MASGSGAAAAASSADVCDEQPRRCRGDREQRRQKNERLNDDERTEHDGTVLKDRMSADGAVRMLESCAQSGERGFERDARERVGVLAGHEPIAEAHRRRLPGSATIRTRKTISALLSAGKSPASIACWIRSVICVRISRTKPKRCQSWLIRGTERSRNISA